MPSHPSSFSLSAALAAVPPDMLPDPGATPEPVGYGRPPLGRRFAPGVSGNPRGRPPGVDRRAVPPRSALERAVARQVEVPVDESKIPYPVGCLDGDGPLRVRPAPRPRRLSLQRALVERLTERALTDGCVLACRELIRLCERAEDLAFRREQEGRAAAEEAARAAREAAEQAARAEAMAAARAARLAFEAEAEAQEEARETLAQMAEDAAEARGEEHLAPTDRALILLDAVETPAAAEGSAAGAATGAVTGAIVGAVKPWVVEAADAHARAIGEPAPGDAAARPLRLHDTAETLRRCSILVEDENGDDALAAWFIDAAKERLTARPEGPATLTRGDEALLQWLRVEEGEPEADWAARLEAVMGREGA